MQRPAYLVGAYTDDMGGTASGIAGLGRLPDGSLEYLGLFAASNSPSYLALASGTVYATCEATATVEEYRFDGATLERTAVADAGGVAPCHVARYGGTVLVSCYVDGHIGVLDAEPLRLAGVLEGAGGGPHPAQDGPHAHSTFAIDESDGRVTVLSADLGADLIRVHELRDATLSLVSTLALPAGTGPRDFLRHPSGLLYVLGELSLEVLVLEWAGGELSVVGATPLAGAAPGDHAAALSVSVDGRFVWAGLRGSNRISTLEVGDGGRSLTPAGFVDAAGDWPRHHVVDGGVMHVAHERSSTVASFTLGVDGIPTLIAPPIRVPSPIFLLGVG